MSSPTFNPEPPSPPPSGSKWLWIILLVALGGVCACGICCGGFFLFGINALKSTEPYQNAFQAAQNDPQVKQQLGEPISDGFMPQGNINVEAGGSGKAEFTFTISGPKGNATVSTKSKLVGNEWKADELTVEFPNGQKLDLNK